MDEVLSPPKSCIYGGFASTMHPLRPIFVVSMILCKKWRQSFLSVFFKGATDLSDENTKLIILSKGSHKENVVWFQMPDFKLRQWRQCLLDHAGGSIFILVPSAQRFSQPAAPSPFSGVKAPRRLRMKGLLVSHFSRRLSHLPISIKMQCRVSISYLRLLSYYNFQFYLACTKTVFPKK